MSLRAVTWNEQRGTEPMAAPSRDPLQLHRRLPGYRPSPLVPAADLAADIGLANVFVKDEAERLGLPSFKILGASWATYRALEERRGRPFPEWSTLEELAAAAEPLRPLTLVAATDGNHGRAVARMARLLGFDAHIFVPADMVAARIAAIEGEGAKVTVVDGTYDDAVMRSAEEESQTHLVVSDTSWPGYERIPRWIIDGYSTIFWEIDEQLDAMGAPHPDVVLVQIGVGAFAAAAAHHFRRSGAPRRPLLVGVEPADADCMRASVAAGKVVSQPGPHRSIMAGLNCGTPSIVAWPVVSAAFDVFFALDDDAARAGMVDLARAGVVSGESGAAGAGVLRALAEGPGLQALGVGAGTTALTVSTEGATDPVAYEEIVGAAPRQG